MEGSILHPALDAAGVWRFKQEEVTRLANERTPRAPAASRPDSDDDGEIAARVFEALEAGDELSDIVIELRIHPAIVRDLYSEWSVSLEDGERDRRHEQQLNAERRDQRELERLLRPSR